MRGFRRFVLWFCFVVVAVASPVQSNEAGTPDSVAQMFETHYRAWRREMLTVLSGSSRTPDCSVRGTPLAMLGVPAVPVLLERYDEFGVPALFRFITKWGPQWQRGVGPDGEVISVCMELPMISGGSYAHVDSRLLAWRWWEEADIHGVLPLDDRTIELFQTRVRDGSHHDLPVRRSNSQPCQGQRTSSPCRLSRMTPGRSASISGTSLTLPPLPVTRSTSDSRSPAVSASTCSAPPSTSCR